MWPFSGFKCGFRFSRSTADLRTVVCDKGVRAFNRSGASLVIAFDIFNAFDKA